MELGMTFENPTSWYWLWGVLILAILLLVGYRQTLRAMAAFAASTTVARLTPRVSLLRRKLKMLAIVFALIAMVAALADPRWGSVWVDRQQRGIDVVFLLDVSRSMLADDVSPDRLARAEQYIRDMMDAMGADRVGLVIFAGDVRQRVPLTRNFSDLRMALEETGPHELPRGGSRIGDGIREAIQSFVDDVPDHKAIVILADGEDQGSDPVRAAREAYEKGIRVYTVGIGDPAGSRIPIRLASGRTGYIEHNGEPVITRLDKQNMEQIALAGGGAYIPAGTSYVNMGDVYRRYISQIDRRDFDEASVEYRIVRYQWFAAFAMLMLLLDVLLPDHLPIRRTMQGVAE